MSDDPLVHVYDTGRLDVGDGHELWYAQWGTPTGLPVLYLHGGPGTGTGPSIAADLDPKRHRLIMFDQRAAGRSTPHAAEPDVAWGAIDLDHHLADIERLRVRVGVESWVVHGYSWGSVLGLAYAERYVGRIAAVVVGAVSTGTRSDIEWLTVHSGRFFPEAWAAFREFVPPRLRDRRIVDAYADLLFDPDPTVHEAAALAWCRWESAHVAVLGGEPPLAPRYEDPRARLGFARQVVHCWSNDSWLDEDEIVANAGRLAGVPGWLVHGRLDVSGPLDSPWRIHQAWPASELIVVDDEGHGGDTMFATCRRILHDLARSHRAGAPPG
jgi:proline iminopeptidase